MVKDCRKPKATGTEKGKEAEKLKSRTRAYALTQEEARGDPYVVSGTSIIDHTFVSVLFDSGASRSFISSSICRRMKCKVTKIKQAFTVENVVDKTTRVIELVDNCTIKIHGLRFPIKLCQRSPDSMQMNDSPDGSEVAVYGDRDDSLTNIISMIKAEKYIACRCEAYLAYVMDNDVNVKEFNDVPVVCNFSAVFLEELPWLPPDWETEFQIYLVPGAQPVAKALYRLAPLEMKELMIQLEELLDRGFIRLSISPWGV
ncbi:hypothetical protein L1987_02299 [Smallanthus sonchifolius]|uniref:Uncharacterized protein n=1 Tax=Smallanthus sonchifolius TaxID=185202 RepID=A0ACB9K7F6_9ASTR|nr:hypothetical protein L1987_02299 [Smallanthus sonchifolius]